jgi:hypothetical protein
VPASLTNILAGGRVTVAEQQELLDAIEKVLPPDSRKTAKAARRQVEKDRKAAQKAADKAAKDEQRRVDREREQRRWPEPAPLILGSPLGYELKMPRNCVPPIRVLRCDSISGGSHAPVRSRSGESGDA